MAKYEITIRCRNKDLKEEIEKQIVHTLRGNIIKCKIKNIDGNRIRLDIPQVWLFAPIITFGYEENLHNETESDTASNFEIDIQCDSDDHASMVGSLIHDQFVGLDDYINNKILLNVDGNSVFVCFGGRM